MCNMTNAETLRAILGNLKQHDFSVNPTFKIEAWEGAVLLEALKDYQEMCKNKEFYYVPFPAEVFNDERVTRN